MRKVIIEGNKSFYDIQSAMAYYNDKNNGITHERQPDMPEDAGNRRTRLEGSEDQRDSSLGENTIHNSGGHRPSVHQDIPHPD